MQQLPQLTVPDRTFIRTLEGWILIVFNIGAVLAPIISTIPAGTSLKWAGILNAVAIFSRSGLKAVLAVSKATGLPPIEPFDQKALGDAETLAAAAPEVELDDATSPPEEPPESPTASLFDHEAETKVVKPVVIEATKPSKPIEGEGE